MRIFFLFSFLLPVVLPSIAQANEQNLAELFFKDKTITWQKTYAGVWDDAIPVQMELLSDGITCKGYFYFGDNKNKYVLSGSKDQNEINLEEQDLHSNKTGQMIIHIENNQAIGTWYNLKHNFNARLTLQEGSIAPEVNYWVRSYTSKDNEQGSMVILHKDFADQINANFYYKPFNKTLFGTSVIKDEESYSQEARLEDYLHHHAGMLHTWKVNDKRIDISYKLGTIDYAQTMDLVEQFPIIQETFADHWMAVDIKYPDINKSNITKWYKDIIDSLLVDIQAKKRVMLMENKNDDQAERLSFRMSIWPQFDLLNSQMISGAIHIKNSWDESSTLIPFMFDLKKGSVIQYEDLFNNVRAFESIKVNWLTQELNKLNTSSALDYKTLKPEDFTVLSVKNEGLAFMAPFDITYGSRQIIIPYSAIASYLSSKYFPL